jgi:signal transduction histidine kinase
MMLLNYRSSGGGVSRDSPVSETGSANADERLNDFRALVATVRHDINNPLAALLVEAQLLGMDDTLKPDQREAVDRLISLTRRLVGQVGRLDTPH